MPLDNPNGELFQGNQPQNDEAMPRGANYAKVVFDELKKDFTLGEILDFKATLSQIFADMAKKLSA